LAGQQEHYIPTISKSKVHRPNGLNHCALGKCVHVYASVYVCDESDKENKGASRGERKKMVIAHNYGSGTHSDSLW
jgi:hypothetical protein